jgi:uracil-DNA glycosylase
MTATFNAAAIDLGDCFFTNFIMGVRVNSKRNTGPSPALAHADFMSACLEFFIQQLSAQQPKVIICLGMIPFKLLSLVSSGLRLRSICIETFKDLDARRMNVIPDVEFDALPGRRFVVVPLCHPSYRQNGEQRFKREGAAYTSEAALLKDVLEKYVK